MSHLIRSGAAAVGLMLLWNPLLQGKTPELDGTAEHLIERARKYDNMWACDQDADQKKALECYQAALSLEPDEEQRLHILYRMAQLYGSAYQLEKGEKPDFRKAIELNQAIVDSYLPSEPLVSKALLSLGDHHVTLRQFTKGLEYFKRVLEYDIGELEQSRRDCRNEDDRRLLEENVERIRQFQKTAVDQVAYCTNLIHPSCVYGTLHHIAATHPQAFIREYAAEKVASQKDPFVEWWTIGAPRRGETPSGEQPADRRELIRVGSPDGGDRPASKPDLLAVRAGPSRPRLGFPWGAVICLSVIGILILARIVMMKEQHVTQSGKDLP